MTANMHARLKKLYVALMAPVIIGFLAVIALQRFGYTFDLPVRVQAVMAPTIFILASGFALAGPIFYRSLFGHRQRNRGKVPRAELYRYERTLTIMALVTPYLALVGYVLQLPRFHLTATLLMALYAIYYYYPSEKRILFDMKIFRAEQ
jgi:hypothetical protein